MESTFLDWMVSTSLAITYFSDMFRMPKLSVNSTDHQEILDILLRSNRESRVIFELGH